MPGTRHRAQGWSDDGLLAHALKTLRGDGLRPGRSSLAVQQAVSAAADFATVKTAHNSRNWRWRSCRLQCSSFGARDFEGIIAFVLASELLEINTAYCICCHALRLNPGLVILSVSFVLGDACENSAWQLRWDLAKISFQLLRHQESSYSTSETIIIILNSNVLIIITTNMHLDKDILNFFIAIVVWHAPLLPERCKMKTNYLVNALQRGENSHTVGPSGFSFFFPASSRHTITPLSLEAWMQSVKATQQRTQNTLSCSAWEVLYLTSKQK